MATQVRETAAGKSISAYIVLNKKGEHVATVNAHFGNGGRVSVDVRNIGDKACFASYATARKTGRISPDQWEKTLAKAPDYYVEQEAREQWAAYQLFGFQQSSASGYGYDKFSAALAGLIIDGHTLADHCGQVPEAEKARASLLKRYGKAPGDRSEWAEWDKNAKRIGAGFANWRDGRYQSLHFTSGLDRLTALGYTVIQAI